MRFDPWRCGLGWLMRGRSGELRPETSAEKAFWEAVYRKKSSEMLDDPTVSNLRDVIKSDPEAGKQALREIQDLDREAFRRMARTLTGRGLTEATGDAGAWVDAGFAYPRKKKGISLGIGGAMRSLVASMDDSTALIQGEGVLLTHPKEALIASVEAWKVTGKTAFSGKAYEEYAKEWAKREGVVRGKRAGLSLPILGEEEIYGKTGLGKIITSIPGISHSMRLYDVRVSEGRRLLFNRFTAQQDRYLAKKGLRLSAEDLAEGDRLLADLTNTLWGYGARVKGIAGEAFFSLPLTIAQFKKLGMMTFAANINLWHSVIYGARTGNWMPAWISFNAGARLLAGTYLSYAIAKSVFQGMGWEVDDDWGSPTFGRAKKVVGGQEVYLNILPRHVRDFVRVYKGFARFFNPEYQTEGQKKGEKYYEARGGNKVLAVLDEVMNQYLTKASPLYGLWVKMIRTVSEPKRKFFGKSYNIGTPEGWYSVLQDLVPITISQFWEMGGEAWRKDPATGAFFIATQFFGMHGYAKYPNQPVTERGLDTLDRISGGDLLGIPAHVVDAEDLRRVLEQNRQEGIGMGGDGSYEETLRGRMEEGRYIPPGSLTERQIRELQQWWRARGD